MSLISDKLLLWKERYQTARAQYGELPKFAERQELYNGTHHLGIGQKDATVVWNIVSELIESQSDNSIPTPKVVPERPTEKTIRNAQVIADMIKAELNRLPFEMLNDMDERMTKINGGSAFLVEWDNTIKTHDTVGDISVRLLDAPQFVPQGYVYETRYMDHLFVVFDDTKERIKKRYGKDVTDEGTDGETSDAGNTEDIVTQVICYYKTQKGIGCFSWAGDTVLIDDANYLARKDKACAKCGKTKPHDTNQCVCGSREWERRDKDFEVITEQIQCSDGKVIPAYSVAKDENGEPILEDYQVPEYDGVTGLPVMDYVFDDKMAVVGEKPRMVTQQRLKYENTKLPYYSPKGYPLVIRKNISGNKLALGISDCDLIKDFQQGINKALTKLNEKVLKAGSIVHKSNRTRIEFSDEVLKVVNITSPEEISMLGVKDINTDISQDLAMLDKYYYMAKSVLGITDTFQGKEDRTAMSGRAKEAQIAQAAGRQQSKRIMKQVAYADMFRMMFEYMLAFSDEPRTYTSTDENGEQIQRIFNRYDFLEQDEYGNWYYDDQYLFDVDNTSIDPHDKQFMLEDLRTDLSIGAYGDKNDPETMIAYWKEKEIMGYPNAARNVKRWEKKALEFKQQQAMQQMQAQMMPPMGGVPNELL